MYKRRKGWGMRCGLAGIVAMSVIVLPISLFGEAGTLPDRVAADFPGEGQSRVWHYSVPPISSVQRLPDAYPTDGTPGGVVRIAVARGEYEPGSFLVWAREDLGKVKFVLEDFLGEGSERFPKEEMDLKFVKVWYQNRNGWFSYFGDTGFKLCPELLVNDEDIIRVDTTKKANYARLVNDHVGSTELWINPPRQFDRRQLSRKTADTFHSMRKDFRDAKELQPVLLPKNEFRNFFLTVHVPKGAKAGLYKGSVRMLSASDGNDLGSVPVEIRVLDFELPRPKCYVEPEKDFLVSFYSYISFAQIMERNGWDAALAKRQMSAILKNQVAHNQTMFMLVGNMDNSIFETIEAMKDAGMRTDVFQGGVFPRMDTPEAMREHARIIADEFDRRFGHHNIFLGYGDEPSAAWLMKSRPLFEAYQSEGLKFFLAGEVVFPKGGYFFDWHNCAREATDTSTTTLWQKMSNASHVAWYANQHVGPENPSLNRRQNGLAAYLSGYTALCNYAHHLGPYNDDSTTYKPMVLAYGAYDGVIDTIAWEGFREGVDDIRYATLMTELARAAMKSADVRVRHLGAKAMQYLAMIDVKSYDQDAVRGEMIRFINELRRHVKSSVEKSEFVVNKKNAVFGAARACKRLSDAVTVELCRLPNMRNQAATNAVHMAVAKAYRRLGREKEGGEYLERMGLFSEAADFYRWFPEKQLEMHKAAYAKYKDRAAFWALLPGNPKLIADFEAVVFGDMGKTATNEWRRAVGKLFAKLGGNHEYVWGEKPGAYTAVFERSLPIARAWNVAVPVAVAKNAVWAYMMLHDTNGVVVAANVGLRDEKISAKDKYYLGLAVALAGAHGCADDYVEAVKAYDSSAKGVSNKDKVDAMCSYGSVAMNAGCENLVRGLDVFQKSLYKSAPKKRYVVHYSDKMIEGVADMIAIAAERQSYDRRYGGNLDFLTTDVTSGERAAGDSKDLLPDPTMEVVADAKGIHFLVRIADPKSLDVELGIVANCSFEGYIAPGENTPYSCFTYTPRNGRVAILNTMYPTFGARRMEVGAGNPRFRFESSYVKDESRHYYYFSWENWMQRVPQNGTVWDFENMCWHRSGNSCWNGTESIHGRSTWGELEFRLTNAQRATIVRRMIVAALGEYANEKTIFGTGELARWDDSEVGDPLFFANVVKPLSEELDKMKSRIRSDMPEEDVFALERDALPRWQDIKFEVGRRRAEWLLKRNVLGE